MIREPASAFRGRKRRGRPLKDKPSGKPLALYQLLYERRGLATIIPREPFRTVSGGDSVGYYIDYLNKFYGCDIRHIRRGQWCLVGEFVDAGYVDYVAQNQASAA